jgi:mono/diheme cytochrome c family protein
VRYVVMVSTFLVVIFAASAKYSVIAQQPAPQSNSVPRGRVLYRQMCASCHGEDAKGHGPAATELKTPPSDLTVLAKQHGGKFPYDDVLIVLLVGTNVPSHGSSDMPIWGPIFKAVDKNDKLLVLQRIKNLSDYLASLQRN